MTHLIADRAPRVAGVGDIVSDVQGLYALVRGGNSEGGFGTYVSDLYDQFSALPDDVRRMNGQIARVRDVLTAGKADTTRLGAAQRNLAELTAMYPTARVKVTALMQALGPILPALNAGNVTSDAIATLASHGIDVVATYNTVHDLFQLRDDAAAQIQGAVRDPALSPALAQEAANALTATGPSGWMTYALAGAVGLMLFSLFRRRSA